MQKYWLHTAATLADTKIMKRQYYNEQQRIKKLYMAAKVACHSPQTILSPFNLGLKLHIKTHPQLERTTVTSLSSHPNRIMHL